MASRRFFALAGVVGVLSVMTALAQAPPTADGDAYPEPEFVPSTMPSAVVARHGMVSAAHPLAARIGVEVLKRGGHVIDATVAVQMALNVVEPQSSGIGGGCFILYYDAGTKQTHAIDGREETPAGARREDFLDGNGKVTKDDLTGGACVGVPGTVAAMWKAHERFGKLPIAELLQPAIRLAEDGIGVTPRLRISILANRERFLRFPGSKGAFLRADGMAPDMGDVLKQPDLGRTLRLLAEHGPKVFYEGEIAQDVVKTVCDAPYHPGRMALEDLRAYHAIDRAPIRFNYHGYELVSFPSPSSGGITLAQMLGMADTVDLKALQAGSLEETELLARIGAVAFADRNAYLGDQDWSPDVDARRLVNPEYVKTRAAAARSLKPGQKAQPGHRAVSGAGERPEGNHTTHFSIVDAQGNVVACTTTIEHGMGCGMVVPGRGFLLNNELTDFDLSLPTGPNAIDPSRRARPTALDNPTSVGGKRPRSSMTPVIVFKDGKPILSVGSPGGPLIIGIVAQILTNVLDHGMDAQQAINAPRLSSRNGPLELEALYPNRTELRNQLQSLGWKVKENKPSEQVWGGAHAIRIRPDGMLEGGADPRREGAVRGY